MKVLAKMQYALKLSFTTILLVIIFRSIHPQEVLEAVTTVSLLHLLAALLTQLASFTIAAYRWQLIVQRLGFQASFVFYLGSYFKGAFCNQGLPTSIGGDGVRIYDSSKVTGSTEDAFFGVFIDRIIGLSGLLLLNIGALLLNHTLLPPKGLLSPFAHPYRSGNRSTPSLFPAQIFFFYSGQIPWFPRSTFSVLLSSLLITSCPFQSARPFSPRPSLFHEYLFFSWSWGRTAFFSPSLLGHGSAGYPSDPASHITGWLGRA